MIANSYINQYGVRPETVMKGILDVVNPEHYPPIELEILAFGYIFRVLWPEEYIEPETIYINSDGEVRITNSNLEHLYYKGKWGRGPGRQTPRSVVAGRLWGKGVIRDSSDMIKNIVRIGRNDTRRILRECRYEPSLERSEDYDPE